MKQIMRMLCLGLLTLGFAACSDKDEDSINVNALVLNEGGWGGNNA